VLLGTYVTGTTSNASVLEKNKTGVVAFITTGTPLFQVATALVSDETLTESAKTPPKVALAVYPEIEKPVPVNSIFPAP
jgi:hypothetical protein